MEMSDNHPDMSDLRHFMSRPTSSKAPFQQHPLLLSDLMTAHHLHHHIYDNNGAMVMGRHVGSTTTTTTAISSGGGVQFRDHLTSEHPAIQGANYGGLDGGDPSVARWPRQETLTLLEIRGRLDYKFKGAVHKAPLWDELARIMSEEYGYQRNGKKCKEKFENLYKYYKKTKEGKSGRQDGKHYRFFRQLEALCGDPHHPISASDVYISQNTPQLYPQPLLGQSADDTTHNQQSALSDMPPRVCDPRSLSNSSNFDTSSSYDGLNNGSNESNESRETKKRKGKRSWRAKTKEFIDLQMKKIEEKQEFWLQKMMKTLETKENERMILKEEWRNQEVDRVEREHRFWAKERAWIEARDSALMSTIEKLSNNNNNGGNQWEEHEVTRLIYVRISMESKFEQCGFLEEVLWDEIASKMAYFGCNRSAIECKKKWDLINKCFQEKGMVNNNEGKNKRIGDFGWVNHHYHNQGHDNDYNNSSNDVVNEDVIYVNQSSGFNNCEMINEPKLQQNEPLFSRNSDVNVNINANVDAGGGGSGDGGNGGSGNGGGVANDSCFRFFLGDGESSLRWESNYGRLKLNKGVNQVLN
ncbi:hypothetical protein vseg_013233 [Gypsophila vaccaria]